mmetsp:Transcript_80256/g.186368  ORF Transcript_80256/g.186368 Transcript_80256/m.186368 type:complete len:482 (-) Transcript_80256:83-1528(-)
MTEVELLSEKLHRYGVLGAGVISDSLIAVQLAEATSRSRSAQAAAVQSTATKTLEKPAGGSLTRQKILEILAETARVQAFVQQEVSALARKLAKGDKKKKKSLSFTDGHKKIKELRLPQEPLESLGLSENAFQKLLLQYEEDEEVMASAQKLLHPTGKGDPERANSITMDKIIEIHDFMVQEMRKVLDEFMQLPADIRRTFSSKDCETTAELLVSIAVEQQLTVHCEDVEQAVIKYETLLQVNPEFTRYTEQLATMMQKLIGASQQRTEKAEFLRVLRHMGENMKKAKAFSKKLFEDYRSKACTIAEAYQRFESFSEAQQAEGEDMPDMSSVEMVLCYDEYRDDDEVRQTWDQSGVETNLLIQGHTIMRPTEEKKGKKIKPSEVTEMQELMVDELKRTKEAAAAAIKKGGKAPWKGEIAVQMVQAIASAAVERRFGTSGEEMTLAGLNNAPALQKSDRFGRATEKQRDLLVSLASLCSQGS